MARSSIDDDPPRNVIRTSDEGLFAKKGPAEIEDWQANEEKGWDMDLDSGDRLESSEGWNKQMLQRVIKENLYYMHQDGTRRFLNVNPNDHEALTSFLRMLCDAYAETGHMTNCQAHAFV
jgi:hypothetical protein